MVIGSVYNGYRGIGILIWATFDSMFTVPFDVTGRFHS